MIYIDPPYNTGKDFVYPDNYKDNLKNYLDITGQLDEEGNRLSTNSDAGGQFHTKWLNMMYPRLRLARNLLSEDGVIFISIDDNEVHNLRKVCDEVFGEGNFVATIIWKRKRGRDNSAKWFSKSHEFLLVFAKNKICFNTDFLELDEETKKAYKNPDNDKRGIYRMLAVWARGTQGGVEYDFTNKNGQYFSKRLWLFSKENLQKLDEQNKLIFKGDNIYRKLFINENKGKIPETIWENTSNAANASDEIKKLFYKIIFDTPKPIPYIEEILKIASNKNSIILDFFSGSGTTRPRSHETQRRRRWKSKIHHGPTPRTHR
jgi:adenine-specific DNA-methyltransferase